MQKKKKEECKGFPAWLTSFGDLMSLLLTFFILLFSISTIDIKKFIQWISYFRGMEYNFPKNVTFIPPIVLPIYEQIAQRMQEKLKKILIPGRYQIISSKKYVLIRFFKPITFKRNDYTLLPEFRKALDQVVNVLKDMKLKNYMIMVVGYADKDEPDKPTSTIKDSWDLSIRRACEVVKYLQFSGVPGKNLAAVGIDSLNPIYKGRNPVLKQRNARVELYISLEFPNIFSKKEKPLIDFPSANKALR